MVRVNRPAQRSVADPKGAVLYLQVDVRREPPEERPVAHVQPLPLWHDARVDLHLPDEVAVERCGGAAGPGIADGRKEHEDRAGDDFQPGERQHGEERAGEGFHPSAGHRRCLRKGSGRRQVGRLNACPWRWDRSVLD